MMGSREYAEYCFRIGAMSYNDLLLEAEALGIDVDLWHWKPNTLRDVILMEVRRLCAREYEEHQEVMNLTSSGTIPTTHSEGE